MLELILYVYVISVLGHFVIFTHIYKKDKEDLDDDYIWMWVIFILLGMFSYVIMVLMLISALIGWQIKKLLRR